MFIGNFEHFLRAKPSFLFSAVFIKHIFFTFLDISTLIFLLRTLIIAIVGDFKRQLHVSGRIIFVFGTITFSSFDELQL